jgi:UDP-N-acetylmuramoyl-tripeptide--D-alanyl-D-alanine ligase
LVFKTGKMEARPLKFIADACAGKILRGAGDAVVTGVSTDSRKVQAGDLFVALAGDRFDGHNFLSDVAAKGVAAVLINEGTKVGELPCAVISVRNTRAALGDLAAAYRGEFVLPLVAIAGSNGKTTTKELVAAILRQKLSTLWSEASFNNDIGVPLTLLRLERGHQVAVLEVGTNHPGELQPLVRMIQPRYGVITNIGREHLEFFGDLKGVAREEGALAELLPAGGTLFLNGDNEFTAALALRCKAAVVRVGFEESCEWRAASLKLGKDSTSFRVTSPVAAFTGEYRINLIGRHQVGNTLFAIALGAELGLSREEIQRGLTECQPAKMRLESYERNGVRVLDDAYNANADSVIAALHTLTELPCKGRTVAVLGDMAELGRHTESAHREVGRLAAKLGVGQLFAVGKMAPITAQAAREAGLSRVMEFGDVDTAAGAVKNFVRPGDLLLLKASRVARLERIADVLRGAEAALKN